MKPNKAGKNMWLRAQMVNQNLKQNSQTQDADGMQTFCCVIHDTLRGYISTLLLLIGVCEPPALTLPLRLPSRDMHLLKKKLFDISRRWHPV